MPPFPKWGPEDASGGKADDGKGSPAISTIAHEPLVLTRICRLGVMAAFPPHITMGQQLNKIIKRKRRARYLKRKRTAAKATKKK
jgi:hypothetical protein